ncbi:VC0807 family protein [Streptomyces sp. RPT161]|uniref:VC0807 family protein n=1 Tax=Streptomyces sp. RPT161 TaxID=3015993 RepID=UPI0022B8A0D6|nr:VC0807 family protein [Streptomyces sp. RPT161]
MTENYSPRKEMLNNFKPLVLDIGLPLGSYYLLHDAFGVDLLLSLALSSVPPAVRTLYGWLRDRSLNGLAALMLVMNIVGIALSFTSGSPRIMVAKDSGTSSVFAIVLIVSAFSGKPLMSAGLRPWLVKGNADRATALDRLTATSARFRRMDRKFTLIWGATLLVECVARVIGAFTLPVATMVWLSNVLLIAAIVLASVVGGAVAADPMEKMIDAELAPTLTPQPA